LRQGSEMLREDDANHRRIHLIYNAAVSPMQGYIVNG
jgi:hypothetical protein